ncbi:hypothetical protein MIND_01124800 [Mycena indigotica]|uniref:Uncharacterized protein n=1 Tax=Mycena indigotica TaxID=2126181 RepID=A0A8H6S7E9_9AGAR|nr:uncharacterized protein MIND_01124800 [Mycena indigotica]KAF7293471.1 hypothetical protein MIND_01124800 [Mycena indigotica]
MWHRRASFPVFIVIESHICQLFFESLPSPSWSPTSTPTRNFNQYGDHNSSLNSNPLPPITPRFGMASPETRFPPQANTSFVTPRRSFGGRGTEELHPSQETDVLMPLQETAEEKPIGPRRTWTPIHLHIDMIAVDLWIDNNKRASTANTRTTGSVLAGRDAKSTAVALLHLLEIHSHHLPQHIRYSPHPGVYCKKTDSISWLRETDHDILLGDPSAPFYERTHGSGPLVELYTSGLEAIFEDNDLWGMRGQYKIPLIWPDTISSPKRHAKFWAAGRWTALSIMHRRGVAPFPLSPFFLLFVIYGKEGLRLSLETIRTLDSEMGARLSPWFSFGRFQVIDAPSDAVAVLISAILPSLAIIKHSRTVEEHAGLGLTLALHVLLGFDDENHSEIDAFRQGFRGVSQGGPSEGQDSLTSLLEYSTQGLTFVATIYDRTIKSLDQVLSELRFEFHGESDDDVAMTLSKLFQIRFIRYLHGHGHPSTYLDLVTPDEFDRHRHDPLRHGNGVCGPKGAVQKIGQKGKEERKEKGEFPVYNLSSDRITPVLIEIPGKY